jgi:AmmeMemoRadiSam system protein A
MLEEAEGLALVRYAREAIKETLGGPAAARPRGGALEQPAATFVTLHWNGQLQGCMGVVEARRPLADDVRDHALAAALDDPRALPLTLEQVDEIDVEVSLLSPLERMSAGDPATVAAALRPGIDGVVFCVGSRRSTYLPQVWEDVPEPLDFLRKLRCKAGFAADFWSGDVIIYRYQVRKWSDQAKATKAKNRPVKATTSP